MSVVKFQLSRGGIALVLAGAVLFSILIFVAGWIAGGAAQRPPAPAQQTAPAATPETASTSAPPSAAPAVAVPAAPPPTATAEPQSFALRVAAFGSEEEATERVKELAARNLDATVAVMPTGGATIVYAVYVGHYADRTAAATAATELARQHGLESAIVPVR